MSVEAFSEKELGGLRLFLNVRRDPLGFFTRLMNQCGAYAVLRINGRKAIMLNDAAGIEHVLQGNSDNYFKGHFQRLMEPLFGDSILLKEGHEWRKRRQAAAPVFAHGNFEDISKRVIDAVEAMFARWDERIDQGLPIDVTTEMTRFTLDAFLRSLFHETRSDVATEMREALGVMLGDVERRLWSPFRLPPFLSHRLPQYKKAKRFMGKVVHELITARKADQQYPEDLLSRLVGDFASTPKQQKALFDEVQSYVLAGHETTAHGLAWALFNLSRYPLVRQRVEEEVRHVLGDAPPTMEHIKSLAYTRQVLDEVFRLFPPVWTMSRETINADRIPLDDGGHLEVAPGDSIMMCHYAVHRREKYWPNPEAFDPDRFTQEAIKGRPKFAWFPFGGGPRLCIGFRFAQVESIIALAMIHQRYSFALVSGQNVEPEPIITLRPKDLILFKMQRRHDAPSLASPAHKRTPARARAVSEGESAPAAKKCPFH